LPGRLFGTPNPAGKGSWAPSIAFSWRSRLLFARPPTLQTLQAPFWHPQPRRQRHQGPINSFLLAFTPAVCQASNLPNFFGTPNPAGKGTRAPSKAFYWRSRLPFARPQTLQTLQTPFWHPRPRRQRHLSHPPTASNAFFGTHNPAGKETKATSIGFSRRSSLPFARPQTLQTLQMFFFPPSTPQAKAPGPPAIAFYWRSSLPFARTPFWHPACRLPGLKPSKRSKRLFGNSFLLAVFQTSNPQTLQMPFWHPQPRRQRQ